MSARRSILLAGLAALGILLFRISSSPGGEHVVAVERGDLVSTVEIEGTLRAAESHQLGPPATRGVWNFKISRMAPEGQDVRAGAAVLSFDASELEKRLVERRAELESSEREIEKKRLDVLVRQRADALRLSEARAKLEKAELKLERPPELVAAREIAALELDRDLARREVDYLVERRRSLDEADAIDLQNLVEQRDRARARVQELQETIGRMTLTSPRDGTVIYVTERGEKKRVGDSVWRHDKVLAVPDLSRMVAEGHVDESDAGKLAVGQRVEIRLDAYPEIPFTGQVSGIGKTIQAPARNSPLRGLRAEIALDETDTTRMRPEMRFRGAVEIGRVQDALLVPLAAIERGGGRPLVKRLDPMGVTEVEVRLGRRNADQVEVLAGLTEGDRLVLASSEGSS